MKVVGIRELKNRLSEYIRMVRSGEEILVSDRGVVVAEISKPIRESTRRTQFPGIGRLEARGTASAGGRNHPSLYPRLPRALKSRTTASLLDEERGFR